MFIDKPFNLLARHGISPQYELKNYSEAFKLFLKKGFVQKWWIGKNVFLALTPKALPLLEHYRLLLLHFIAIKAFLHPRSTLYDALLNDLRFLDTTQKEAREFLFLGDWQLHRKPTLIQLQLSQQRYLNEKMNSHENKKA